MEKLVAPRQHLSKGVRDQEAGRAWTGRARSRSSLASLPLHRRHPSPALPLLPCPAAQGPLCLLPSPGPEPYLTSLTGCLSPGVWRYSMRTGSDRLPGVPCLQPLGRVRKFLGPGHSQDSAAGCPALSWSRTWLSTSAEQPL